MVSGAVQVEYRTAGGSENVVAWSEIPDCTRLPVKSRALIADHDAASRLGRGYAVSDLVVKGAASSIGSLSGPSI